MKWEKTSEIPVVTKFVNGEWEMHWRGNDFYLCNREILLCPVGLGVTEQETFEHMLKNIEEYELKLKKVRSEIQDHLAELKGKDHEHDSIG